MEKRYLIIPLLLLIGLLHADLLCSGITNPHLGDNLNIHCLTQPSSSTCTANVSNIDYNAFIMQYPEYPPHTLQEFKEPYSTSSDGQFQVSIFIDNQLYYADSNYTATITCFNSLDNSTNQTDFTFTPILYKTYTGQYLELIDFAKSQVILIGFIIFIGLCVVGFILIILRAFGYL